MSGAASDRCLRGHAYSDSGFYRDPATGERICIACQAPLDLSTMTKSQRYYYRNLARRRLEATERTRRRRQATYAADPEQHAHAFAYGRKGER